MSENAAVASMLASIADLLEARGENRFKVRAYRVAAQSVDALDEDIASVHARGALRTVPGVGEHLAEKISTFLDTGKLDYLEKLKKNAPREFDLLVNIEGLGPKRALALYDALGIQTVKDLEDACIQDKVASVQGFGRKSQDKILEKIGHMQRAERIPYAEAKKQADILLELLRNAPGVIRAESAGSIRRRKKTIGDIDLLAAVKRASPVVSFFSKLPQVRSVIASGLTKVSVRLRSGIQADLRLVRAEQFGAAWLYFTGSKAHNIELRKRAQARGWKLNEYALLDQNGGVLAQKTEKEIYHALGFREIPPALRESADALQRFRLSPSPKTRPPRRP